MRSLTFIFVLFCFISSSYYAQRAENNSLQLSGNLHLDSKAIGTLVPDNGNKIDFSTEKKKSVLLAGALSFVLPGAGQFYNESYWKAAAFGAIEITAIVIGLKYDKKGDDQTSFFESFAQEHWSVERYANWTIKNAKTINSGVDPANYKVFNQDGSVSWAGLNSLERDLGSGYSHALPPFGDQQYYELIGKYPQYSHGWDDAIQSETDFHILSPRFSYYSIERGKANDYYNVAAKAVLALYINHIASIIDAVWDAASINKSLKAHASYEKTGFQGSEEYSPKLTFTYSF